jgi:hypothetical protein
MFTRIVLQCFDQSHVNVQNMPRQKDATKTSRRAILQQQTPASGSKRTRVQYTAAVDRPAIGAVAADKPPLAIANGALSNAVDDTHAYSNLNSASARRASRSSRDGELLSSSSTVKQHAATSSAAAAVTPGDSGIRRSSFHKQTAAAAAPAASSMPAGQASDAANHNIVYSR